jgi:hypothetical protein
MFWTGASASGFFSGSRHRKNKSFNTEERSNRRKLGAGDHQGIGLSVTECRSSFSTRRFLIPIVDLAMAIPSLCIYKWHGCGEKYRRLLSRPAKAGLWLSRALSPGTCPSARRAPQGRAGLFSFAPSGAEILEALDRFRSCCIPEAVPPLRGLNPLRNFPRPYDLHPTTQKACAVGTPGLG